MFCLYQSRAKHCPENLCRPSTPYLHGMMLHRSLAETPGATVGMKTPESPPKWDMGDDHQLSLLLGPIFHVNTRAHAAKQ